MDSAIDTDTATEALIADPAAFDDAVNLAGGQVMYEPGPASNMTMAELKEPPVSITAAGDALPGTNAADFAEARDAFAAEEEIDEGLGPIFNAEGCGTCHTTPVVGGSGVQIERRFGRISNGTFFGFDSGSENHGGTLRQLFTVGTYVNGSTTCTIPLEFEPASANVKNVGRRTTSLLGLGLMDAMPDAVFPQVQATQPASVRGIAQPVNVVFPDIRDPSQRLGSTRIGRFGWKGGVPSLLVFSGDAYLNEMGITTQSCVQGTSILAFANENLPNNIQPPAGCNGGDLAPAQPAGNPQVPQFTDDAVGSCAGGLSEVQDDLQEFRFFMEHLAGPPRDLSDSTGIFFGSQVFQAVGCAGCHVTGTFITPSSPFNGVPGRFQFQPFGDFMLHDMGSLADNIGNTGDSTAKTRLMRTAPLWGNRFQTQFLHDGRATTVRNAILAHDGTARTARDNFAFGISAANQDLLLRYVRSL